MNTNRHECSERLTLSLDFRGFEFVSIRVHSWLKHPGQKGGKL